jgi:hypothetical protein
MPTVGSEYYYEHTYISKLGEDTIIEGVTYFKFLTAYDVNSSIWETEGFLREDIENRKVYVKQLDKPEALLYDFNANVGDTISRKSRFRVVLNCLTYQVACFNIQKQITAM